MRKLIAFFKRDKLSAGEQLIFLDYLKQSLANGFSLNASLAMLPAVWSSPKPLLCDLKTKVTTGQDLGKVLLQLGFSKNIATQLNMALLEGNLIDCLKQLTKLIRLKNKQLKKLRAELAYPVLLIIMMVCLLIAMQTFLKNEFSSDDWTANLVMGFLILLVLGAIVSIFWLIFLLRRQNYAALKKLSSAPFLGATIKNYVQYLLVYDLAMLLGNGFSLQQICEFASQQESDSLQATIANRVSKALQSGQRLEQIIAEETFLPNSLLLLTSTGSNRSEISKKSLFLAETLFYELNLKLNRLVLNVQPVCFIFIGTCILGMYLKILMPMYTMMQNI